MDTIRFIEAQRKYFFPAASNNDCKNYVKEMPVFNKKHRHQFLKFNKSNIQASTNT